MSRIPTSKTFASAILTILWVGLFGCSSGSACVQAADSNLPFQVGFGRQDITPKQPVRLSGYASRQTAMQGIRDRLFVRTMVMGGLTESKNSNDSAKDVRGLHVLISIEGLAVTANQTKSLTDAIDSKYGIGRAQVVVCSTHSHAAPHPSGAITNLFRTPLDAQEQETLAAYTKALHHGVLESVDVAIQNRRPARLFVTESQADFAVNRRVLDDGVWSGFGVAPDGPTDRRVRVLGARDESGELLGASFLYACHCTTLGPDFNEVTGDWAGIAAAALEDQHQNAIFVPIIGCGADANPEPRGSYDAARQHGNAMQLAVNDALDKQAQLATIRKSDSKSNASEKDDNGFVGFEIEQVPVSKFGYAGLSAEQPDRESLRSMLEDENVSRRNWARQMLDVWTAKGRLPESYPAPIHTWTFGDSLVWVFLGGEVVVDYQIRLEEELNEFKQVWVAAYTDDCFAYVASERMRSEGGYEVDFSMIYYSQPGRWESGTEDLLIRRVHEVLESEATESKKMSPEDSLSSIQVPEGFEVSLVAHEPVVEDPINLAFAADGSLWVVEMADYPLGVEGGGRIKRIRDLDGDGVFETAELFLEELNYPTSVMPWRDGVLVIAAPDIFFARDVDGDGDCDEREVLLSGVGEANPQHRASGFEWGLDGWVHFGAGDDTHELQSHRIKKSVDVHHGDVRWHPDRGHLEKVSGATQFLRSRDRWGRWYGNSNSVPLFHYRYDSISAGASNSVQPSNLVLNPGVAPPVFPSSRVVDRFNDLFAQKRFTSACGSIVLRDNSLGDRMVDTALVCEPVHNLVARFSLEDDAESVSGQRFPEDIQRERDWLTSTDTWFRPVRCAEGPDGSVYVVDMYRRVIEHPQWIPDAWQGQMNLRAGSDAGRIYRVSLKTNAIPDTVQSKDQHPVVSQSSDTGTATAERRSVDWVGDLASPHGLVRDLAMQRILWDKRSNLAKDIRNVLHHDDPAVGLQAFATLVALKQSDLLDWKFALDHEDARVVAWAIRAAAREFADLPASFQRDALLDHLFVTLERWQGARQDAQQGATSSHRQVLVHQDREVLTGMEAVGFAGLVSLGELPLSKDQGKRFQAWVIRSLDQQFGAGWLWDGLSLVGSRHAGLALDALMVAMDESAGRELSSDEWNGLEQGVSALWQACSEDQRTKLVTRALSEVDSSDLTPTRLLMMLAASQQRNPNERVHAMVVHAIQAARERMRSKEEPLLVRIRATRLLGSPLIETEDRLSDLLLLLQVDQPGEVRRAALAGAYRVDSEETATVLLDAWPHLLPDERRIAGGTLMQRGEWTRVFVDRLVQGTLGLDDLDPATVSLLANCRDYFVMKKLGGLIRRPTKRERKALVDRYTQSLPASQTDSGSLIDGSLSRGAKVYREQCVSCHEPVREPGRPEVPALAPSLANLKHWNEGQWITAILDPNANVEPKYRQYQVLTNAGQVFVGRVMDESDQAIQLAMTDGRRLKLQRSELESMRDSGISLMPEGLEAKISPQQMGDLLLHLQSL